ncbi:hypothetical protein XENOCAPTIV_018214 [Xenoophorus captivus]|uniref:Uncharacterized protein n=1 Tax=Xenoophorus captivus TaxID=1517983 RepID=A0ABV0QTQ0_9TELE
MFHQVSNVVQPVVLSRVFHRRVGHVFLNTITIHVNRQGDSRCKRLSKGFNRNYSLTFTSTEAQRAQLLAVRTSGFTCSNSSTLSTPVWPNCKKIQETPFTPFLIHKLLIQIASTVFTHWANLDFIQLQGLCWNWHRYLLKCNMTMYESCHV